MVTPNFQVIKRSIATLNQIKEEVLVRHENFGSFRKDIWNELYGQVTSEQIDEQKQMWISEINKVPSNEIEKRLVKLAYLERSTASLNLDSLSIDPKKDISKYLVNQARKDVVTLLDELN